MSVPKTNRVVSPDGLAFEAVSGERTLTPLDWRNAGLRGLRAQRLTTAKRHVSSLRL
jgi:hypothetical protein